MKAVAIVLRGSFVAPALVLVEIRKWQRYGHSGILLSDGRIVEASALKNEVVVAPHPCEWYNYERLLTLEHLGVEKQERIGALALSMVGWKYDWRAAKTQATEGLVSYLEEDSRRVICFEHVALAVRESFRFPCPPSRVDARDLVKAWRRSKMAFYRAPRVNSMFSEEY